MKKLELEKFYNTSGHIMVESKTVFDYPLHTHSYYEMILYEPFDGNVTVNGKNIKITSMTAVIVSPLNFHEIQLCSPACAKYIKVGFNGDIFADSDFDFSFVLEHIEADSFLHRLFREISENSGNEVYLKYLVNCAVYMIQTGGRKIMFSEASKGQSVSNKALKLINERFKDAISLPIIAKELSITPQYLSFAFVTSFGMNFSEYLSSVRLKYAASMIENTEVSITDICFESGYCNFSHFSRTFKKQYGLSPRAYRNQFLKER